MTKRGVEEQYEDEDGRQGKERREEFSWEAKKKLEAHKAKDIHWICSTACEELDINLPVWRYGSSFLVLCQQTAP